MDKQHPLVLCRGLHSLLCPSRPLPSKHTARQGCLTEGPLLQSHEEASWGESVSDQSFAGPVWSLTLESYSVVALRLVWGP
jgi:hypothetical protein